MNNTNIQKQKNQKVKKKLSKKKESPKHCPDKYSEFRSCGYGFCGSVECFSKLSRHAKQLCYFSSDHFIGSGINHFTSGFHFLLNYIKLNFVGYPTQKKKNNWSLYFFFKLKLLIFNYNCC
jgi:hypothetical protein